LLPRRVGAALTLSLPGELEAIDVPCLYRVSARAAPPRHGRVAGVVAGGPPAGAPAPLSTARRARAAGIPASVGTPGEDVEPARRGGGVPGAGGVQRVGVGMTAATIDAAVGGVAETSVAEPHVRDLGRHDARRVVGAGRVVVLMAGGAALLAAVEGVLG